MTQSLLLGDPAAEPHQRLLRGKGEVVVTKKRVSAFTGSDLELVLRAREVNHLVLAGIATSGVVLCTLRDADRDYQLTVLEDLCLYADDEVHRVLTHKVFPRQAEVTGSADWTRVRLSAGQTASTSRAAPLSADNARAA